MSNLSEPWWGFSTEHGWVVLDRTITCNKAGLSSKLLFLRCSDAFIYSEQRERWNEPYYVFAPRYIQSLTLSERGVRQSQLAQLQLKWSEFHEKVAQEGKAIDERKLQDARNCFFRKLNRDNPGMRPATNRVRRFTHCYDCKHLLDSAMAFECNECSWLVCECGACGCGYSAV